MSHVPEERPTRALDVITAVMLGLVSVVTALGAWQAATWDVRSQEYERDAGDARDVSVNQSVQADYAARLDTLRPRFRMYRQAASFNRYPALVGLMVWRARRRWRVASPGSRASRGNTISRSTSPPRPNSVKDRPLKDSEYPASSCR